MNQLKWKKEYNLGIPDIDNQHKKLLDLINDLFLAQNSKAHPELIFKVLKGLHEYTVYHFEFEESLFDSLNENDPASHKLEHAQFVLKLKDFQTQLDQTQPNFNIIVECMIAWLKDWLIKHILVVDKQYCT